MSKFYLYLLIFYALSPVKCYIISVIIPIYNTARYLDESIGSILNQTIGLDNIQLILVNDGSTDNTEEICLKYQNLYSQNIFYIKIEHGGVSKARNVGMTLAKGKYINFVDSDDKWDYNAFSLILKFFDNHKKIECVAARIKFFGIRNHYETLDYKFYKTRIVNLTQEYNCIQVLCLYEVSWDIFYPKIIIPQIKINFIKREILRNLIEIKTEPDTLYIHIRGGDIFQKKFPLKYYAQPPLCFYEKIIKNIYFRNIYIVSMDTSNIIVNSLTKKYRNIIFNRNNLEYDLSLLSHAYNIVLSISSFAFSAIKLNDNLKDVWEYDLMRISEKILLLHHHIFKFNIHYKIHTMRRSNIYQSKMFSWKNTPEQLKLMIDDDCPYDFIDIKLNKINK